MKILFVDNDLQAIMPCMASLPKEYFVRYAKDFSQGFLRFQQDMPDIVVLDISEDRIANKPEKYALSNEMRKIKPEVRIIGWSYENVQNEDRQHYDRAMTKFRDDEPDESQLLRLIESVKD